MPKEQVAGDWPRGGKAGSAHPGSVLSTVWIHINSKFFGSVTCDTWHLGQRRWLAGSLSRKDRHSAASTARRGPFLSRRRSVCWPYCSLEFCGSNLISDALGT